MRGAVSKIIAPWGMKVFLVLTPMQREALRFHLDMAKRYPYGHARHELHVCTARFIAGSDETIDADPRKLRHSSKRSCPRPPRFVPVAALGITLVSKRRAA